MRKIKFRAWDTERKEMFFPNWLLTANGINASKMEHPTYGELHTEDGTAILMQYIGLKDKNGKEIFEGDIVEIEENYEKTTRYLVEYDKRCCQFGLKRTSLIFVWFGFSTIKKKQIEIMGNIYENPDLFGKTTNGKNPNHTG